MASNSSTSSPSSDQYEVGGVAYFNANIGVYLPYVIMYSIGILIGIIGNSLICGAILIVKKLRTTTYMLVFNLAAADISVSAFVDTFTIMGVFVGEDFFVARMPFCRFIAAFCLIACETSLMNIGLLAINRYIFIRCHNWYDKIFTFKKTLMFCCISWSIGILITLPDILGWGGLGYDQKTLSCLWNRLASHSYSLFFPLTSIITPCVVILILYTRIFFFIFQSKMRVAGFEEKKKKSELKSAVKTTKILFISFIIFVICWLPYGLVVMIDQYDHFPKGLHAFTMLIAHFNSALNPVLLAISDSNFKKGYRRIFKRIFNIRSISHFHHTVEPSLKPSQHFTTDLHHSTQKY